jgi:hypothetical protein
MLEDNPAQLAQVTEVAGAEILNRYEQLGKPISSASFAEDLQKGVARIAKGEVPGMRITVGGQRVRMTQVMRNAASKLK